MNHYKYCLTWVKHDENIIMNSEKLYFFSFTQFKPLGSKLISLMYVTYLSKQLKPTFIERVITKRNRDSFSLT